MLFRSLLFTSYVLTCATLSGQSPQQPSLRDVLEQTEANVSLVRGVPFHAEMRIAGANSEPEYQSSIVVDWAAAAKYRVEVRSRDFHQIQIVVGDEVQEQTEGSFYPGWLHGFVVALFDPIFVKNLVLAPNAQLGGSRSSDGTAAQLCVDRNNRPNGITDDLTWSGLCITPDRRVIGVHDFTTWMEFSDYRKFNQQQIARRYESFTGSYDKLVGTLTALRTLKAQEIDTIRLSQPTPKDKRITFTFISTKAEEARLESTKPFEWPPVREGKTEGYMIVHALTDVTGQVRETSKHNSDNPGLEEAGRQAALGYKFKPMLIDGVPAQIEMPLVLHFKTTLGVPLPFLKGEELSKVSNTCHSPILLPRGVGEPGRHYHVKVSVDETGKRTGETFSDGYPDLDLVGETVESCNFSVYRVNGVPTYYHAELEFIAPQ